VAIFGQPSMLRNLICSMPRLLVLAACGPTSPSPGARPTPGA